jgi:murein L,D-transpeptidase YafK
LNKILIYIIALSLFLFFSCKQENNTSNETQIKPVDNQQNSSIDTFKTRRINVDNILRNPEVIINKSKRTLSVYSDSNLVGYYKIALGLNPTSDKIKAGDFATPEGTFYICSKNSRSKYHLSLLISYPNKEYADRGLKSKLISQNEYNQIINAINNMKTPPQNTNLGGDICIHGGGTNSNWTFGCIALEDKDIEDLFKFIQLGTKITIIHSPTSSSQVELGNSQNNAY